MLIHDVLEVSWFISVVNCMKPGDAILKDPFMQNMCKNNWSNNEIHAFSLGRSGLICFVKDSGVYQGIRLSI